MNLNYGAGAMPPPDAQDDVLARIAVAAALAAGGKDFPPGWCCKRSWGDANDDPDMSGDAILTAK